MKYLLISFCLLGLIFTSSCKKENTVNNQEGYIHPIVSDSDMAVVASFEINDGNYMVVGRDFLDQHPGLIVKLDKRGKVLWEKRVSPLNTVLWKVLQLPGSGFVTLGHNRDIFMTVCRYDIEANLISTVDIPIPTGSNAADCSPSEIIKLKNGNFAISGYDGTWSGNGNLGFLIITDNSFSSLYTRTFGMPNLAQPEPSNVFGLLEMPDSSIVIRAAVTATGAQNNKTRTNLFLIRTDLTGIKKTTNLLIDSVYSETPNCLIENGNGMLCITGRMIGLNEAEGLYVNYNNQGLFSNISGSINFCSFSTTGQLLSRKKISSYSGYGMISSIKPTADGGYILCGTVNQNNSTTIVSNTKIYLLKLDASLNEQWAKTFNTIYQSFGIDAFQSTDGGYVVSGHHRTNDSKYNMLVIKTDESGNVY